MGGAKKIILWGRADLICQGVEIFLRDCRDYVVCRIPEEDNLETVLEEIEKATVDVVIINPGQQLHDPQLALELINAYPGIQVITLDHEDSSVDVYHRRKVNMQQVSDLLDLIG